MVNDHVDNGKWSASKNLAGNGEDEIEDLNRRINYLKI